MWRTTKQFVENRVTIQPTPIRICHTQTAQLQNGAQKHSKLPKIILSNMIFIVLIHTD